MDAGRSPRSFPGGSCIYSKTGRIKKTKHRQSQKPGQVKTFTSDLNMEEIMRGALCRAQKKNNTKRQNRYKGTLKNVISSVFNAFSEKDKHLSYCKHWSICFAGALCMN